MDDKIRLFTAGINGDVGELCKLMVISNMSNRDLMRGDPSTKMTILKRICSENRVKAFTFLKSILPINEFVDHLFSRNKTNVAPIESGFRNFASAILKKVFAIKEVRDRFKVDNDDTFRLFFSLFIKINPDTSIIDYIMIVLKDIFNKENGNIDKILKHKCIEPKEGTYYHYAPTYHRYKLPQIVVEKNTIQGLKKFVSIIGEKLFVEHVSINDDWNILPLEIAVRKDDVEKIKYILSFKEIKDRYLNDDGLF